MSVIGLSNEFNHLIPLVEQAQGKEKLLEMVVVQACTEIYLLHLYWEVQIFWAVRNTGELAVKS